MLQISRSDYEALLAQLHAAYPLEACGLMAGRGGRVFQLYPADNTLQSSYAFFMEPRQQIQAMLDLEAQGWELLAIYHSHPYGPPVPSTIDVAQAYYPEAIQVIVSLQDRARPSVRAFRVVEGEVIEVPLSVVQR